MQAAFIPPPALSMAICILHVTIVCIIFFMYLFFVPAILIHGYGIDNNILAIMCDSTIWRFSGKLYLQYNYVGDTIVYHWANGYILYQALQIFNDEKKDLRII